MSRLGGDADELEQRTQAVRDSADQFGTSNKPIANWITLATIRIIVQGEQIKQLNDRLNNIVEHHGLSEGL